MPSRISAPREQTKFSGIQTYPTWLVLACCQDQPGWVRPAGEEDLSLRIGRSTIQNSSSPSDAWEFVQTSAR